MTDERISEIEARLSASLQAVARLVSDEPPTVFMPEQVPVVSVRLEHTPAGAQPRRARVVLAGVLAVVVVLVGGFVLFLALRDSSSERARIDTPAASVTTAAAPTTVDPNLVDVPNVVGKVALDAQSLLAAAGFGSEVTLVSSAQPAGTVVAQSPAGNRAAPGSAVQLTVSSGS